MGLGPLLKWVSKGSNAKEPENQKILGQTISPFYRASCFEGVKTIMEGGDEGIERVEDSKDLQQQSKALDKLTDHVEDRQLDSTRVQEVCV